MEQSKLVKEIITTTTERYGDSGSIKEKVTESREKIYSTAYTDEELKNAKPIEKKEEVEAGENPPPASPKPEAKSKEEQIKEAASAIDAKKQPEQPYQPQPNPFAPWTPGTTPPPSVPQYNVANRSATVPVTKFPWET